MYDPARTDFCYDDQNPQSNDFAFFPLLHKFVEDNFCVDLGHQVWSGYSSGSWVGNQFTCAFPDVLRGFVFATGEEPPMQPTCVETTRPPASSCTRSTIRTTRYSGVLPGCARLLDAERLHDEDVCAVGHVDQRSVQAADVHRGRKPAPDDELRAVQGLPRVRARRVLHHERPRPGQQQGPRPLHRRGLLDPRALLGLHPEVLAATKHTPTNRQSREEEPQEVDRGDMRQGAQTKGIGTLAQWGMVGSSRWGSAPAPARAPKGSCGVAADCGGDPSGTWSVTGFCSYDPVAPFRQMSLSEQTLKPQNPSLEPLQPQPTTDGNWCYDLFYNPPDSKNPVGDVSTVNLWHGAPALTGGTVKFDSTDNTYAIDLHFLETGATSHFSQSCISFAGANPSCTDLAAQLTAFYMANSSSGVVAFQNIVCGQGSPDGCDCQYDYRVELTDTGGWSKSDNLLVESSIDYEYNMQKVMSQTPTGNQAVTFCQLRRLPHAHGLRRREPVARRRPAHPPTDTDVMGGKRHLGVGLAALALATTLSACEGKGVGGTCGDITGCGGNLVGTWKISRGSASSTSPRRRARSRRSPRATRRRRRPASRRPCRRPRPRAIGVRRSSTARPARPPSSRTSRSTRRPRSSRTGRSRSAATITGTCSCRRTSLPHERTHLTPSCLMAYGGSPSCMALTQAIIDSANPRLSERQLHRRVRRGL